MWPALRPLTPFGGPYSEFGASRIRANSRLPLLADLTFLGDQRSALGKRRSPTRSRRCGIEAQVSRVAGPPKRRVTAQYAID